MAKPFAIPRFQSTVTGYKVLTVRNGVAKEFGGTPEEYKKAKQWAEDHVTTYGELFVVEATIVLTRKHRVYKEIPETVHPLSEHIAHRQRISEFEIP